MSEQLIQTPAQFGDNGNFLLERALGEGGMGGVYMGRDKMLDRPVAVKVMTKELGADPEFVDKFRKEAQAVARLIHPNIAQVYSYGISDGMPYIAMELVPGGSLYQVMKNSPSGTDIPRIMKIGEQLAQALRCAADQGLVHGDVKPENVLLDSNGNAKLVDFGLAAMQKDTQEIWGTPYYIAPEKVLKEQVDFRADMYSLGGTLYHALTGSVPFDGPDTTAVVKRRFEKGALKRPSELRSDISPAIDALVMKMLATKKEDRFPSFEALLQEFSKVMSTGLVKGAEPPAGRKKPTLRLRRGGAQAEAPAEESVEEPKKSGRFKKFKVKNISTSVDGSEPSDNGSGEEQGGVGGKVALVIGGTILAIAAVAGFLVWYVAHDKAVKEEQERQAVLRQLGDARESIGKIQDQIKRYQDEFDRFSDGAIDEAQKTTDELSKFFDASVASRLKLPKTKELYDAEEKVREKSPEEAAAQKDVQAKAAEAAKSAAAAKPAAAAAKPAASNRPKFRDPVDDEADPMSPDGQRYLKEKKEWEAKQAEMAAQAAQQPAATAAAAAPASEMSAQAKSAMDRIADDAVATCHELWERAYSCKACAIILHHRIDKLLQQCDDTRKLNGEDRDTLTKLAKASNEIKDEFGSIKASEEFSKVQKGISFIKQKGKSALTQTLNRIREEQLRVRIEEEKRKAAEEEVRRKSEAERLRKELIASEEQSINDAFTRLVDSGVIAQLDWIGAERQLNYVAGDFKTAEGEVMAKRVIGKVKAMGFAHEVMKRNLKNYTFTKGKTGQPILGYKVLEVTDQGLKLLKTDGKSTTKMTWKKFYAEYRGNMNELINTFIVNGKNNGKPELSLKEWAEAMLGTALTMRLICSDAPSAMTRAEQIAKEAYQKYDSSLLRQRAREYFPDIDFSKVAESE